MKKYDESVPHSGRDRSVGLTYQGSGEIAFSGLTAQQGCAAASIEEQVLALRHILDINLVATIYFRKDAASWSAGPIETGMSWALAGAGKPEAGNRGSLTLRGSAAAGSIAS